jgi:hypothetical protein
MSTLSSRDYVKSTNAQHQHVNYVIKRVPLTSFLNSSALSLDRIVIPRENIIDVARLAMLKLLLLVSIDDGEGRRMWRMDDNIMMFLRSIIIIIIFSLVWDEDFKKLDASREYFSLKAQRVQFV